MDWRDVPGWCDFDDLYQQAVDHFPSGSKFIELGTYLGKSCLCLAQLIEASGKAIEVDTIDCWMGLPKPYHDMSELQHQWAKRYGSFGAVAISLLAPYEFVHVVTRHSLRAVAHYPSAAAQFVFLDDDHTSPHVRAELEAWWPIVAPGGWMAGHDFDWPSVHMPVREWAAEQGLTVEPVSKRCWRIKKEAS